MKEMSTISTQFISLVRELNDPNNKEVQKKINDKKTTEIIKSLFKNLESKPGEIQNLDESFITILKATQLRGSGLTRLWRQIFGWNRRETKDIVSRAILERHNIKAPQNKDSLIALIQQNCPSLDNEGLTQPKINKWPVLMAIMNIYAPNGLSLDDYNTLNFNDLVLLNALGMIEPSKISDKHLCDIRQNGKSFIEHLLNMDGISIEQKKELIKATTRIKNPKTRYKIQATLAAWIKDDKNLLKQIPKKDWIPILFDPACTVDRANRANLILTLKLDIPVPKNINRSFFNDLCELVEGAKEINAPAIPSGGPELAFEPKTTHLASLRKSGSSFMRNIGGTGEEEDSSTKDIRLTNSRLRLSAMEETAVNPKELKAIVKKIAAVLKKIPDTERNKLLFIKAVSTELAESHDEIYDLLKKSVTTKEGIEDLNSLEVDSDDEEESDLDK